MQYPPKPWTDGQKFVGNGTVYIYNAADKCWNFSPLTYNRVYPSMQFIIPKWESIFCIEISESSDFSTIAKTYSSDVEADRARMLLFSALTGSFANLISSTVSNATEFSLTHLIVLPEVDLSKRHYCRYRWFSRGVWGAWNPIVGPAGFSESNIVPIASANTLGGIRLGSGFSISADGVLDVVGGVSGAPNAMGSVLAVVPEGEEDLFLIMERSISGEFDDAITSIDTLNNVSDREKLYVFTGLQFDTFTTGVPHIFGGNAVMMAAGLPLNSYVRYKWTPEDISGASDWHVTYYPSAVKVDAALASGPAGQNGNDGVTPHIDVNGNWFIGDMDTEIPAQGPAGNDGEDGEQGLPGEDGAAGVTPHVDEATGNWFIGETDTGIAAQGPAGADGTDGAAGVTPHIDGATGNWFIGETNTGIPATGPAGEDGAAGVTPHIDEATGNWFIGETDTGIAATGPAGEDGADGTNGITPHIDAGGNWFIGETDTGIAAQGPAGTDGADGANGVSPHIDEATGNWFIGETDTGIPATGPAGEDGEDTYPVVYTNDTPSVIEVGGIPAGTTFDTLTFGDFVDRLLYPELFPVLTNPSLSSFTCSVSGFRELGETIGTITFTAAFSRGSIDPQYQSASPYRSGAPNTYTYTGTGLTTLATTALTDQQTVTGYVVQPTQSWTCRVSYDVGVQPKGSKGTAYNSPLSAGTTSTMTRTFVGVYPYFATTVAIATLTKQVLASMTSTYVETNMVGESDSDKQATSFPSVWKAFTGVQFLNTVSNQWEWLGGDKTTSLNSFTQTAETRDVQGNAIDYIKYTHNGSFIGSRKLRWYTT